MFGISHLIPPKYLLDENLFELLKSINDIRFLCATQNVICLWQLPINLNNDLICVIKSGNVADMPNLKPNISKYNLRVITFILEYVPIYIVVDIVGLVFVKSAKIYSQTVITKYLLFLVLTQTESQFCMGVINLQENCT